MNEKRMKKVGKRAPRQEMAPEYDFSNGVRGKYATKYAKGANVVVLDPDVAKAFRDSESVNRALRACERMRRELGPRTTTSRRRAG